MSITYAPRFGLHTFGCPESRSGGTCDCGLREQLDWPFTWTAPGVRPCGDDADLGGRERREEAS